MDKKTHCGSSLFLSGPAKSYKQALPLLRKFVGGRSEINVIGSSGGVLVSSYVCLKTASRADERLFLEMCQTLEAPETSFEMRLAASRTWVRAVTGGSGCTFKQWNDRHRPFSAVVFNCSQRRPDIIPNQFLNNERVAEVLVLATSRETPSQGFPRDANTFANIEPFAPPRFLVRHLRPPVIIQFETEEPPVCAKFGWCSRLSPVWAASLYGCYETMLRNPRSTLTWTMTYPSNDRVPSAGFPFGRWSSVTYDPPSRTSMCCTARSQEIAFAVGMLTWLVIVKRLALTKCPEDALGVCKVIEDKTSFAHGVAMNRSLSE